MWDLITAIVSGLANSAATSKRPAEAEAAPSLFSSIVLFIFLTLLAAGIVFLSFIPDRWWQMLLIQFLALLVELIALAELRSAQLDRRKRLAAPGRAFPVIDRTKPDSK
jgi:hypothetical protein